MVRFMVWGLNGNVLTSERLTFLRAIFGISLEKPFGAIVCIINNYLDQEPVSLTSVSLSIQTSTGTSYSV